MRISQQRRRVVGHHQRNTAVIVYLAAEGAESVRRAKEGLSGDASEAEDHFRLQDLKLLPEVWLARIDLLRMRVTVIRRPAFEDVADKDLFPLEVNRL